MKPQPNAHKTSLTMFVKRASLVVLGVFYLYAALLQLNDPDSEFWIAIYCFAAVLVISRAFGKINPIISGIYGLMCFSASGKADIAVKKITGNISSSKSICRLLTMTGAGIDNRNNINYYKIRYLF